MKFGERSPQVLGRPVDVLPKSTHFAVLADRNLEDANFSSQCFGGFGTPL